MKFRIVVGLVAVGAVLGTAGCAGDDLPDVTAPAPSPVESTEAEPTELPEGQCDPGLAEPLLGVSGVDTTLDEVSAEFTPAFIAATFEPLCAVSGRLMITSPDTDPVYGNGVSLAVLRGVEPQTVIETARANGLSVSDGASQANFTTDEDGQGSLSWQFAGDYADFDAVAVASGVDLQPDDLVLVAALRD